MLILAGDVGGTSTRLAFLKQTMPGLQLWPRCITRAGSMAAWQPGRDCHAFHGGTEIDA